MGLILCHVTSCRVMARRPWDISAALLARWPGPGLVYKELIPKGVGGSGGSHKLAAYSNLIFPQPNFGSRFFLGVGGSQSQKDPPPLINEVWPSPIPCLGCDQSAAAVLCWIVCWGLLVPGTCARVVGVVSRVVLVFC